jgi:hypothetical protein
MVMFDAVLHDIHDFNKDDYHKACKEYNCNGAHKLPRPRIQVCVQNRNHQVCKDIGGKIDGDVLLTSKSEHGVDDTG